MKAILLKRSGEDNNLVPGPCDLPNPEPSEVLIKVESSGVNRPDIMQRRGLYQPPKGASEILGLEVSGTVEGLGEKVTAWQKGNQVCALTNGGGYAEYVAVPETQCLPVPAGLNLIEAASLPETFFTVWNNVFDRAHLKSGESILIHGGGSGIGVTAIQMAKSIGARVYTTAGSDEKCQRCEQLGADKAINYRNEDFSEALKVIEPNGIDVILDMVAGDYLAKNIKLAAMDGRIVNIGIQGGAKVEFNYWSVIAKRLTLTGSTLRAQSTAQKAAIAVGLRKNIWPKIEAGEIKPVIDSVFPLEQVAEAHRLMESSAHFGKIMLQVEH